MKTIINHSNDPYFNLALEEYVFKHIHSDADILLLWVSSPSVILGRNQVVFGEVNISYCETQDIPIIRRISGGGTVYHDLGNLNFSVITKNYKDVLSNYAYFTKPLINYLNSLGVRASFSGKSDIVIGKKKISGNAQMYHQQKMLHHGTILFNTDLTTLNQVIKGKTEDIKTPAVDSNRSNVTNVSTHLKTKMSLDEFKAGLLKYWLNEEDLTSSILLLSDTDYSQIEALKSSKYLSWYWNYGESPNFSVTKSVDSTTMIIKVVNGLIEELSISTSDSTVILDHFKHKRYDKVSFESSLNQLNHDDRVKLEPFTTLLFD